MWDPHFVTIYDAYQLWVTMDAGLNQKHLSCPWISVDFMPPTSATPVLAGKFAHVDQDGADNKQHRSGMCAVREYAEVR